MSSRRLLVLEIVVLVGLALLLLGSYCEPATSGSQPTTLAPNPQSLGADASAEVDTGNDGILEDVDSQTSPAGPPAAVVALAIDSATGSEARAETSGDADSVGVDLLHVHAGAPTRTEATATARFEWVVATPEGPAEFNVHYYELADTGLVPSVFVSSATVELECGANPENVFVDSSNPQRIVSVTVGGGSCTALVLAGSLLESASGAGTRSVSVVVTSRNAAGVQCVDGSQCASGFCNKITGSCGTGGQAEGCTTPSDCNAGHPLCVDNGFGRTACSNGQDSFCRWDGECAVGASCTNGFCTPDSPCATANDCGLGETCTDGGSCVTSPDGTRGAGCFSGLGCASGLCVSNVCVDLLSAGDDCTQPDTQCSFGTVCVASSGVCEDRVGTGGSCAQDNQCLNFGIGESCVLGTCTTRSGAGGSCDTGADCFPPLTCNGSLLVCE